MVALPAHAGCGARVTVHMYVRGSLSELKLIVDSQEHIFSHDHGHDGHVHGHCQRMAHTGAERWTASSPTFHSSAASAELDAGDAGAPSVLDPAAPTAPLLARGALVLAPRTLAWLPLRCRKRRTSRTRASPPRAHVSSCPPPGTFTIIGSARAGHIAAREYRPTYTHTSHRHMSLRAAATRALVRACCVPNAYPATWWTA